MGPSLSPLLLLEPLLQSAEGQEFLGLGILLVGLAILLLLFSISSRLRRQDELLQRLQHLERIEAALGEISKTRAGLDLGRLEEVLGDIRQVLKQADERSAALADSAAQPGFTADAPARPPSDPPAAWLADRVKDRLVAMGFEQVEILTPLEELEAFALEDGDVIVEARRGGALHKGRLSVRGGGIAEVQLRAAYETFP